MAETILTDNRDGVLLITLNRPESMNSLNRELLGSLADVVKEIAFDRDVRVVVITGAGEKSFCSGADLKERATMSPAEVKQYIYNIRNTFTMVENLPKPVIAAINGFAFGGGTELAMAADIRIAAPNAVMGLTETSLGIIPGAGGTQRLARLVGKGKAKELVFLAQRLKASEALEIGLVNRVAAEGKLLDEALEMAAKINENAPIALEMAKYAINHGSEVDLASGLALESNCYAVTIPTKDRQEGLLAFREKRKPVYIGE
ncbi:MAG: enoyl-CoA hydratase/isomerase family protein [Deltaproteobacteria bacterium]|nr:enoyl-CoA hydratase/isomerase family protein [Candidatus Anaeroferrophillus wilburensis]MBN2890033.1 enoyl-CoA hydratase/isomerase family protein [Deltaproteobacteria bacterium]